MVGDVIVTGELKGLMAELVTTDGRRPAPDASRSGWRRPPMS
jgi:hypothetical protein